MNNEILVDPILLTDLKAKIDKLTCYLNQTKYELRNIRTTYQGMSVSVRVDRLLALIDEEYQVHGQAD